MNRKTLGEICKLLDLRPHVIRYWEQMVPLFDPEKDLGGRRTYGEREIHLLYRLKFLVQERKYTLEGAVQTLVEEGEGLTADLKANIQALRKELLETRETLNRSKLQWEKFMQKFLLGDQRHLEELILSLPPKTQAAILNRLGEVAMEGLPLVSSVIDALQPETPIKVFLKHRSKVRKDEIRIPDSAADLFARGSVAVLTFLPENGYLPSAFVDSMAFRIRQVGYQAGRMVPWFFLGDGPIVEEIQKLCIQQRYFGLEERAFFFRIAPLFPYLFQGNMIIQENGELAAYSSGIGGCLWALKNASAQKYINEQGIEWFYSLPLNPFSLGFPDEDLCDHVLNTGKPIGGTVFLKEGVFLTTGVYLLQNSFLNEAALTFSARKETLRIFKPNGNFTDPIVEVEVERLFSGLYRLLEAAPHPIALQEL